MPWLKTVGCDCPECGDDPCDPGCPCTFFATDQDVDSRTDIYDVTGQFIISHDLSIQVAVDASVFASASFEVFADGVSVYSSGCLVSTGDSTVVSIPAGTTEISITIVTVCGGGDPTPAWDYVLECV